MEDFVAVNTIHTPEYQTIDSNGLRPKKVAIGKTQKLSAAQGIVFLSGVLDFVKNLSSPEICFLKLVIEKTNYGLLSEVPIPRSDILKVQSIPSLAIKQIREKLVDIGLITVSQKRIGRGSEAWVYSLCIDELTSHLLRRSKNREQ